jgi:hypothetical protein
MIELLTVYRSSSQPVQAIICTPTVCVKIARPVIDQSGECAARPLAALCNAKMACGRLAGTAMPTDPSQGLKART